MGYYLIWLIILRKKEICLNNIKKMKEGYLEIIFRGKEVLFIFILNKGVVFLIEER